MFERTFTVFSAGKLYPLTGWKIGWVISHRILISASAIAHSRVAFCASTPLQDAIAACLELEKERKYCEYQRGLLQANRDKLVKCLVDIGLDPIVPQGSYFVLIDTKRIREDESGPRDMEGKVGEKGELGTGNGSGMSVNGSGMGSGSGNSAGNGSTGAGNGSSGVTSGIGSGITSGMNSSGITSGTNSGMNSSGSGIEPRDWRVCRWLTKSVGVAAIPPSAFYSPDHVDMLSHDLARLCYCKDDVTLELAMERLRAMKPYLRPKNDD